MMNFGSREILIVLGVLVVLGIILDGLRRVRAGRDGKLRNSTRRQPIFDDDSVEEPISELPSGGARVVGYRDDQTADQLNTDIRSAAEHQIHKVTTPFRELEQVPLGLDDTGGGTEDRQKAEELPPEPHDDELGHAVVFHLMASSGEVFPGRELDAAMVKQDMFPGADQVYHRYRDENGSGSVLFSIANAINPGTFEFDAMNNFATPGLTFFMIVHDSDEALSIFDDLLSVAQSLERTLGGELKDERRSTLTRQTIAHRRQQVVDYTHRSA